jgi:hypothetical protein
LFGGFAAPGDVAKASSDSTATSRIGEDFDPAFPTQRITVADGSATFDPLWLIPANPSHEYLAYAMYSFDLIGYGGNTLCN